MSDAPQSPLVSPDETTRRPLVSRESVVPVALAVTAILAAIGITATFSSAATRLDVRLDSIEVTLSQLGEQIRIAAADRWRRADMIQWAELLAAKNPTLIVPVTK
jgi:hypothetical protein